MIAKSKAAMRQLQSLIETARLGSDLVAKCLHHIGYHHPDHGFVLDKQDRQRHPFDASDWLAAWGP